MTNSKLPRPSRNDRPDWRKGMGLHPDFPLFPHQNGRWAKKVRGKLHYFGKVNDDAKGEAALLKWLDEKDDLLAGRTPRTKGAGLTVGELCDRFLQAKDKRLESGEITFQTRQDYEKTTNRIVGQFGKNRLVSDLASDDFETLRASIAKTRGPVALGNEIQRVRIVFKHAYDEGLIGQPVRYGAGFKRPSSKVLRLNRAKKGPKLFEAAGMLKLIAAAEVHLRAMIHLAVNCGFGNSDCGTLPLAALDLEGGWVNYHRPKTGIDRRCPLWPETVKALRESLAQRPPVKATEAEPLVFVTKYGASWAKETADNPITKEFRKLLDATGLHREGLGFYTLRHTFRTIADASRDQPAVDSIMGHADASMAARYRERIDDSRLLIVTNHVRAWLWPQVAKAASPLGENKRKRGSGKGKMTSTDQPAPLRIVG
jgi:integrase